jgi:predicted nucleotidyltransferase
MLKYSSLLKGKSGKKLKNYLNNPLVADIFLYGSAFKDKLDYKDIDILVLFRNKDYDKAAEILHQIKHDLNLGNLHLEHLFFEEMFKESIFSSLIHEGFSLRHNQTIGKMAGYNSRWLFTYTLDNLKNVDKVRFSQALYGRKGLGLLQENKGEPLGKGAFLVPVEKEHLFREMLDKFKIKFKAKRVFVKD